MRFLFVWFVKLTGWIPQLLILRLRVFYEDKSVQSKRIKGGAIVVSNHNAVLDFAVMMYVFWRRTLRCVVAEIMYQKNFLFSLFLRMIGAIKVDRGAHDFAFLEKSADVIKKGGVVEIYPEGRIPTKDDAERPLEFKPSAVYLALETGAPIIPVYNGRRGFKGRGNVIIGKPINMRELYDDNLDEKANIENLTNILRGKIIELGKELEEKTKTRS